MFSIRPHSCATVDIFFAVFLQFCFKNIVSLFFYHRRVVVTEYAFHDSSLIGLPSVLDNTDVAFAHVAFRIRAFNWHKMRTGTFCFFF